MPEEVCSICKKHIKYHPPLEYKKKIQGMCPSCQRDQDRFLDDMVAEERRIKEYRKTIHEPPGYNKENK